MNQNIHITYCCSYTYDGSKKWVSGKHKMEGDFASHTVIHTSVLQKCPLYLGDVLGNFALMATDLVGGEVFEDK